MSIILDMDVLQSKVIQNVKLELSKLRPTIWLEKLNQIKEELNTLTEKIKDYRDRLTFELLTSEHSYVLFLTTLLHVFKIPITKYQKNQPMHQKPRRKVKEKILLTKP